MFKKRLLCMVLSALVVFAFQATRTLAGTTGGLSGRVITSDGSPLAGARVSAASPSETVSTTSGPQGTFSFVSLNPDTYSVTVSKEGYESTSQAGVTVLADNTQTVTLRTSRAVRTLGQITTRASAELVKPGTSSDVYSVNATTQAKVASLGGGGSLDQAYSAIAAVPGVVVAPGQSGWAQSIHIRGGDYDQVGFEFDGVPVVRSYDLYPTTNASSLGQQELQVYTGAEPANSQSQGLSGYINQVIRSGTYPGFGSLDLGVGAPTFYNKASLEVGGATPNRNFSYFVGLSAIDGNQRYINNSNGADVSALWGIPVAQAACPVVDSTGAPVPGGAAPANNNYSSCYADGVGPGGYVLGGYQLGSAAHLTDRENVVNLHFGIPHKDGMGKDDIQLLYDTSELYTLPYSSALDFGLPLLQSIGQTVNGQPAFPYLGSVVYTGQLDQPLPANFTSLIQPYNYPNAVGNNGANGLAVPITHPDGTSNGQSIIKLQYQHNISSNAYFRLYGYTFYSDWLNNGPNESNACCIGFASTDYEVMNHTRGLSATFADQINPHNLINLQASLIGASNLRVNNFTPFSGSTPFAYLVNSTSPKNGVCYALPSTTDASGNIVYLPGPASPVSCSTTTAVPASTVSTTDPSAPALSGNTCDGAPCQFFVVENGFNGGGNKGKPLFTTASLTDEIKAGDKLVLDAGLRYDRFDFKGSDTNQAPGSEAFGSARDFWFNAFNQDRCAIPGSSSPPSLKPGDPRTPCPAGTTAVNLINQPNFTQSYSVYQPRLGGTYTLDPDNVLRFSTGEYTEAPSAAYEQYNVLQQDLPGYDANLVQSTGYQTSRAVAPAVSYNYDLSLEHHFKGSDASFKLTPYYRQTKNQIQSFYLDQKTAFVSGLNAGKQTASGVELQLNKGDFNKNGLSGIFSYTYTHSMIKFTPLPNGSTVLDSINQGVGTYNAYTSACAGKTTAQCGGGLDSNGNVAAPCYTSGGQPDPACAAGSVANPYWNAPAQPLFDTNASYLPYDTIPGGLDSAATSFITPNAASLIINYKRDKLALTPSFQYFSGGYYGAPFVTPGIDPASGCAPLPAGTAAADPRYPYGSAAGAPYDATTCPGTLGAGIPNPFTGKFDNLGAFRQPNQFLMHMQVSYEASPRITLTANLANIVNRCFGGDTEPWTRFADNRVCAYNLPFNAVGVYLPTGNSYNPGSAFQPQAQFPYQQYYTGMQPFNAYLDVKVKL